MKNHMKESPIDYFRGYKKYHYKTHTDECIRHVEGSNTVVFFLHCMIGSPKFFNDYIDLVPENWSIHSTLLKGLGGTIDDLATINMEPWKAQVRAEYNALAERYDNIIILAHSMGTLFAIPLAIEHPDKIKGMFLLAPPLNTKISFSMIRRAMQLLFDRVPENDVVTCMAREVFSVEVTSKIYRYFKCFPIYFKILDLIFSSRKLVADMIVPTKVVLSTYDEFTRLSTQKYFYNKENIDVTILEKSRHFCYETSEYDMLLDMFSQFCSTILEEK